MNELDSTSGIINCDLDFQICCGVGLPDSLGPIGPRLDHSLLEVDKGHGDAQQAGVAVLCGGL